MATEATEEESTTQDVDWKDLKAPWYVAVAGAALGMVGLLSVFAAFWELLTYFPRTAWWLILMAPMLLQALLTTLMAPLIVKARAWAAIGGSLLCAATAISLSLWWCFTWLSTKFDWSWPVLITALVAWPMILIVPVSIPACLRVSRARRTLYKT